MGRQLRALQATLLVLGAAVLPAPAIAQAPPDPARSSAARSVEDCDSVVLLRCSHPEVRNPADALLQERTQERRRQSRRAETRHDGPEYDEIEIIADRVAGAREERWARFSGQVADSHRPDCLTDEAVGGGAYGLFTPFVWGYKVATGRCK